VNTRAFAKDDDQSDENAGTDPSNEPGYQFEGFRIELSDKVMLTPVTAGTKS
jgi:hypothetical protein